MSGGAAAAVLLVLIAACVPRAAALRGELAPRRVPLAELPPHHQQIVFDWSFTEGTLGARGEGVARIAPPDSVRLDLFLAGGFGSGTAYLLGDSITAPGGAATYRYLPPPTLLWAGLGRLVVPPASDTVVRVDGDTLRADIGRGSVWRVTFVRAVLARVERIQDGRLMEWVARSPDGTVRYQHEPGRRTLRLAITRVTVLPPFDETLWPD